MADSELFWAAGFWDGEGCAFYTRYRYGYKYGQRYVFPLNLSISQVEREPLERFAAAVGAGNVRGPYGPYKRQPNRQPVYTWRVGGRSALPVIELLLPLVCTPKREQIEKAVAQYLKDVPDHTHCKRGHPFDGENTRIRANGRRACRACERLGQQRRRAQAA